MLNWYRNLILIILVSPLLISCAGVARMSEFPKSNEMLNFEEISMQNYDYDGKAWNQKTQYEYYIEVQSTDENVLFEAISKALTLNGYIVKYSDKSKKTIIGKRGLRMNEWSSITGIYYKAEGDKFQVFFKNAITQDITGGWKENRAKEVAETLCSDLMQCKN